MKGHSSTLREPGGASPPVRIALVDDEEGIHLLVRRIFEKHAPDWMLDSHLDARTALIRIPLAPPQAVLMDVSLPDKTGIECAKHLKRSLPELPIVMFSAHVNAENLLNCMFAGSSGCLFKPTSAAEIVGAIKKAMNGSLALCSRSEKTMLDSFRLFGNHATTWGLTEREGQILACLRQHKTDKEIAETLRLGTGTVHSHVASIFKKLDVHSRAEAIGKIFDFGPPG